ncbi:MAG: holo-ACP synthase [Treponema sp.]|jgi:holo-[acyl-carrier protein] synthase|nr:holo-ACP synthase [Treponema sp.]
MITGIGIDIVQINRMEQWLGNDRLLERFFHPDELNIANTAAGKNNSAAQILAARFAAKEAFGKALGTGLAQIVLRDICVHNSDNGKPQIKLFNTALDAFKKSGASFVHISLSHEKDNAIAMIVLEA